MKKQTKIGNPVRIILEQYSIPLPEEENVYFTPYGTICFDWEKGDKTFSLEVGREELGYFIEEGDVDTKQVDSMSFYAKEWVEDLQQFLGMNKSEVSNGLYG